MRRRRSGWITLRARLSGSEQVEIVVADDGVGMSDDVQRHAFDPFFTTLRGQGGTGLGLHIVHTIVVEKLGGRLKLTSEAGAGTAVQLVLPRIAPR